MNFNKPINNLMEMEILFCDKRNNFIIISFIIFMIIITKHKFTIIREMIKKYGFDNKRSLDGLHFIGAQQIVEVVLPYINIYNYYNINSTERKITFEV